jgi:uncharacterized repeat protein (TIGR01451 family)
MKQCIAVSLLAFALSSAAGAVEVTVKNDSLTDLGTASIVWGFAVGEKAASWLTSPCTGNLRAVQVFWRSPSGTTGETIQNAIEIFRGGTFPTPGALVETVGGPVLTDGVINEYRYLDENNVIPLIVPVTENETFVVSFQFATAPLQFVDPSVTRDTDGILSNRNALMADIGGNFIWFNSATLGLTGDWVIRAVIDCPDGPQQADVGVAMDVAPAQYTPGQPLTYTIVVDNAGPAASPLTTVVDIFPAALGAPTWTCAGSGGAMCPASGSGGITHNVNLPALGAVTYTVTGTVALGTTGLLTNTVTAVVGGSVTDPSTLDNTAIVNTAAAVALPDLFRNGFED